MRPALVALVVALVALATLPRTVGRAPAPLSRRHDLLADLAAGLRVRDAVDPGHALCRALLDSRWHGPETATDGSHLAWTAASEAAVTLPVARAGPGRLVLRACGAGGHDGRRVRLVVNGTPLPAQLLPPVLTEIAFACPTGLLRAGDNTVLIATDRTVRPCDLSASADARPLGVYVDWLLFEPDGPDRPPRVDPYEGEGRVRLDRRRSVEVALAAPAGAALSLAWDVTGAQPGDSLLVACVAADGDSVAQAVRLPAAGADSARVQLRFGLPAPLRLRLSLIGPGGAEPAGAVELTRAALERALYPHNVVLIVVDTLRPDFLGCYGAPADASPAIDRLARDGILFETAVSPSPITGPAHAALMTSRWPSETGIVNNAVGRVREDLPVLAQILREFGLDTGASVSISPVRHEFGFARGFDRYEDGLGLGFLAPADTVNARALRILDRMREPFFLWAHYAEPHEPYDAHGYVARHADVTVDGRPVARIPTSDYTPTAVDLTLPDRPVEVAVVADHPARLRILQVVGRDGPDPPLSPGDPPSRYVREHRATIGAAGARRVSLRVALNDLVLSEEGLRERYGREVRACDARVGALLDTLRAGGLYDDALVVFAADHGESLGEHGVLGHVENLHGPMIRVPLIVKPPRGETNRVGVRRRDPASLVDILPTVLARLGLPPPPGARGRDLLAPDAAAGPAGPLFCETHRPQAQRTLYGLRDGKRLLMLDAGALSWEFFDLRRDPREMRGDSGAGGSAGRKWRGALLARLTALGIHPTDEETNAEPDEATRRALRALGY